MQSDVLAALRRLSDAELVDRVRELVGRERGCLVEIVAHLAELDTRDVHLRLGHGSLFAYCRDVLALSEQEAYSRITVARAARRFPLLLRLLEEGALNLTTARLLAPHLTPENHERVLEQARHRSKSEIEELAAALWPRPDVPSFVRKLPPPRTGPEAPPLDAGSATPHEATFGTARWPGGAAFPPRSGEVTPLAPDRYKVQVTIGAETLEKLRLAKDLLRHAVPSGDEAVILDRALSALLSDLAQKKFAAAGHPRPAGLPRPGARAIPAEVKRKVWLRDLGRCAFVGSSGRRCSERGFLEFHHVQPYALGGEATLANIELRCRSHNAYEARLLFGHGKGNAQAHGSGYGNGTANGNGSSSAGVVREARAPYVAQCIEGGPWLAPGAGASGRLPARAAPRATGLVPERVRRPSSAERRHRPEGAPPPRDSPGPPP
jgi:hypothetical protein